MAAARAPLRRCTCAAGARCPSAANAGQARSRHLPRSPAHAELKPCDDKQRSRPSLACSATTTGAAPKAGPPLSLEVESPEPSAAVAALASVNASEVTAMAKLSMPAAPTRTSGACAASAASAAWACNDASAAADPETATGATTPTDDCLEVLVDVADKVKRARTRARHSAGAALECEATEAPQPGACSVATARRSAEKRTSSLSSPER